MPYASEAGIRRYERLGVDAERVAAPAPWARACTITWTLLDTNVLCLDGRSAPVFYLLRTVFGVFDLIIHWSRVRAPPAPQISLSCENAELHSGPFRRLAGVCAVWVVWMVCRADLWRR